MFYDFFILIAFFGFILGFLFKCGGRDFHQIFTSFRGFEKATLHTRENRRFSVSWKSLISMIFFANFL